MFTKRFLSLFLGFVFEAVFASAARGETRVLRRATAASKQRLYDSQDTQEEEKTFPGKETKNLINDLVADLVGLSFDDVPRNLTCSDIPKPTVKCDTFDEVVSTLFQLVGYHACENQGASMVGFISPFQDLFYQCLRPDEPVSNSGVPGCVHKSKDGTYDETVPVPDDILELGLQGSVNKYGWGADFHEEFGIGVVIHSAGALSALGSKYSLPTFTLRNRNGEVIYQGIYKDSIDSGFEAPPITGIRSALVVDLVDNIVTVIAASIGNPVGSFLKFEFDLDEYQNNGGFPIVDIYPVTRTAGFASSVRAQHLLTEDIILYAPLFDSGIATGGPGSNPGFPVLRFFNWRTATELGINIALYPEEGFLLPEAFVWDFECLENALCWVNTNEIIDPLKGVRDFNEKTIARLFSFPRASILPVPAANQVITMKESAFKFDGLDYSVLSMEPISEDSAFACTLSGFLFALAQSPLDGSAFFNQTTGTKRSSREVLQLFELGQPQQCNVCEAKHSAVIRRDRKLLQNKGPRKSTPKEKLDKSKDHKPRDCQEIKFQDQKNTNAYVWTVKECGGKIFAGTNDLSYVVGEQLTEAVIEGISTTACGLPGVVEETCGGVCPPSNTEGQNSQYCRALIVQGLNGYLEYVGLRSTLAALLVGRFFEEDITPGDFGFDLFMIDKQNLFKKDSEFKAVTLNGFSELRDGGVEEGIRNMVCHTPSNSSSSPKLVIASATFGSKSESSSTYVLDLNSSCVELLER